MAKLRCFDLLNRLFPRIYIPEEVRNEVVLGGAGLPGASEVSKAEWIEVKQLRNQTDLLAAQQRYALGVGELSTILMGKALNANATPTISIETIADRTRTEASRPTMPRRFGLAVVVIDLIGSRSL